MDPARIEAVPTRQWLPRTRGDGPMTVTTSGVADWAPPHPRGWTLDELMQDDPDGGSPAPAGMDLSFSARPSAAKRLPRTRGDGPHRLRGVGEILEAPPDRKSTRLNSSH